jgi:putative inorganic carbon (hco3(-)) transporter
MTDWWLFAGAVLMVAVLAALVARIGYGYRPLPWAQTGTAGNSAGDMPLPSPHNTLIGTAAPAQPQQLPTTSALTRAAMLITRWEIPLLLLMGPLVLFPSRWTVLAPAAILLLWAARFVSRGYLLPGTPLDPAIVLMMIMVPVSLLVTPYVGLSLGKLAMLLYGVALFYALVDYTACSLKRLEIATHLFLAAGGLMALLGLLGTDWQYKVPGLSEFVSSLPRWAQALSRNQTGFHPNIVAGALLWIVLPLTALVGAAWSPAPPEQYRSARRRLALTLLLVLTGGTLLLTQSRTALLAALLGVGLLAWLAVPRARWPLVGLLAAGLVLAMFVGPTQVAEQVSTGQSGWGSLTEPDNMLVRVQVWKSALNAIADHPLTGIGIDAFRRVMPTSYPAAAVPDSYDIGHAHNQLLQAALDLGLPGLVGYLALWLGAAALCVLAYRAAPDRWRQALAAGVGAALLASGLHGLVDAVALVSKPGVFFWALLALPVALWAQTRITRKPGLEQ